jgi:O-antigen ligase
MNDRAGGAAWSAIVWRSLGVRLVLAAIPAWFTIAVLIFSTPWRLKLIVGAIVVITAVSPAAGLLATAVLAPLGHLLAIALALGTFRLGDAIVLAFLTTWVLRPHADRDGPQTPRTLAWLLALAIVSSVMAQAWQVAVYPGELADTVDRLFYGYYQTFEYIGFIDGARILGGLALVAAVVTTFRRHPRLAVSLPAAIATSGTLAAAASVTQWWTTGSYRVSALVADVNAAGSYFAMVLVLAVGMALRAKGRGRVLWAAAAVMNGIGLWFSESRSALSAAATVIVIAAAWAATSRFSVRARAATLVAIVIAALGAGTFRARLLEADPTYRGAGFREQFNATSLRMIGARPLFGVGVGQYSRMSPLFLPPQLAWTYGSENAHNFFLQIGSELGLVGLGLFGALIGSLIVRSARALTLVPQDARLLGAAGGAIALLATCLTGHPFLVDEVAYPFWIQFGLVMALAESTLLNRAAITEGSRLAPVALPRARSLLPVGAAVAILLSVPMNAARGSVSPRESQAIDGFYRWETLEDGGRFRWTSAYASVFVPADVTRVEIPVRAPTSDRADTPMGVEVMTAGIDQGRTLIGETWAMISVRLPGVQPPTRFKRIDLKVDRTWQPALYIAGSADLRTVGVQVGELRLFRD